MSSDDSHLRWREIARRTVTSHSLFNLHVSERASARGTRGEFLVLEAPDWVNVVAVVKNKDGEDCFLMVRQFRHGAEMITTEFPAGLVEPGEDPEAAARRELEEETGWRAAAMKLIGRVSPNPAFMNNWCSVYLAEDLAYTGKKSLDELEELDCREVPVRVLREKLGTGEFVNSLVIVAFLWYTRATAGIP